MNDLKIPVVYLDNSDFTSDGRLIVPKDVPQSIPFLVMVQASWCPHCVNAKPDFQAFSEKHKGRVISATIQSDGSSSLEKALSKRIDSIIPDFRGFPHYLVYVNGRPVKTVDTGRSLSDLENALREYL